MNDVNLLLDERVGLLLEAVYLGLELLGYDVDVL